MASSISNPRATLAGRLVRYGAVPALVGGALGFALLWFGNGAAWFNDDQDRSRGGFAAAVDRAAPAVVNIFSRRVVQHPLCELPRFRVLCERFFNRGRRLAGSLGSGVMVREDGYILTNYHVIAAGDDIVAVFNDGRQARAMVVGADPETDLAVVKVEGAGFPTIARAASEGVRVGDIVLAIGNPLGVGQSVSMGIVSAKGRYGVGPTPYDDFIQTDAAVNPGNSGGALVDQDGLLVGINMFIYSRGGGSEGVGFAIPVARAVHVLNDILKHGRVLRGWLGVVLSQSPARAGGGLAVLRVLRGTPAHEAGLMPGDLLLSVNGESATTAAMVTHQVENTDPGSVLTIRFMRNGAVRVVEATAGLRP